jgi:hypothetical protein
MKNINEYSDQDLANLHEQFKKLKTYYERVEFVYGKFGRVFGAIKKDGTEYSFSIKTNDKEENRVRWMYFFDRKKEETFEKLLLDYKTRYEKSQDQTLWIKHSLLEVRQNYESSSNLKYGYEMGSLAKGLDWIDWNQKKNHTPFLIEYYEGFAYYELERWLIGLKEDLKHGYDQAMVDVMMEDGLFDPKVRFVIAHQLGIIDLLEKSICKNDRRKLSELLSVLFGCRLNSRENDLLYLWVKKYYSEDQSKSPINKTNTEKASRVLNFIGVSQIKSEK